MKVVKRVDNKISLGQPVQDFNKYIVVLKNGGVLIRFRGAYTWVDIKTNNSWGTFANVSAALQSVEIEDLYAFEDYEKFAEWSKYNVEV